MRRLSIILALALVPIVGPAVISPAHGSTAGLAAGSLQADFNNDGFIDAAVGVPFEDIGAVADAGSVNVLYGSASGLTGGAGSQQFWQGAGGVPGPAEAGDLFGFSLATGDFNNDGFADLAVGVPFEDIGSIVDAGLVNVLYGSASGLTGAGSQQFWQGAGGGGVSGTTEAGDLFGFWLASGDFNANSFADLAVGVVGEDIGSIVDAGSVNVLPGSAAGLIGAGSQQFWQGTGGLPGTAEAGDSLGFALVAGDFNNDTFVDLAAGAPFEAIGSAAEAGSVNVLHGSASGLTSTGSQQFWQGAAGVAGMAEAGDFFGASLAAGDFNNDSFVDLVAGVPFESIGSIAGAGAVDVLGGTAGGLTGAGSRAFWQGVFGVPGTAEAGDLFGFALVGGDLSSASAASAASASAASAAGSTSAAGSSAALSRFLPRPKTTAPKRAEQTQATGL